MNARGLGYRVLYDPEAVATDFAADSISGEFARRVRLAVGSFRALPDFLKFRMTGFTPVAFFYHKLLRWILPFLLIGLLASNLFLLDSWFFRILFAGQLCFYSWAMLGLLLHTRLRGIRYVLIGYFVLAMNLAFLVGFFRSFSNRRAATWQRVN
jgi:biofilm PGA synthesis N-glycosyltransferase PgaC